MRKSISSPKPCPTTVCTYWKLCMFGCIDVSADVLQQQSPLGATYSPVCGPSSIITSVNPKIQAKPAHLPSNQEHVHTDTD